TSGARRRRTAGQQSCDLRLQQVADGGVGAAEAEVLAAAAARDEVREPELPRGEERAQVRRGGVPPGCGLGLSGEEVGDLEPPGAAAVVPDVPVGVPALLDVRLEPAQALGRDRKSAV